MDDDGINLMDVFEIGQEIGTDYPVLPPSQACRPDSPENLLQWSLGSLMYANEPWPDSISRGHLL